MNLIQQNNKILQQTYEVRKYFEDIKKPEIGQRLEAAISGLVIAIENLDKFITKSTQV